jgi:hypothetical protein
LNPVGALAEPSGDRPALKPPRLSYSALLGGTAWSTLPVATRARFERHDGSYAGAMRLDASRPGVWVERLCRLVGSPLPPAAAELVPATVEIAPDPATGGSRWTRRYMLPGGGVEISSVKAVDRDGTLVERLPFGVRMRLAITVSDAALHFMSTGYYLELPGFRWGGTRRCAWRFDFPSWWLPGRTHVVHSDLGDGRFRFTMTIRHALLGDLFRHDGVFRAQGD